MDIRNAVTRRTHTQVAPALRRIGTAVLLCALAAPVTPSLFAQSAEHGPRNVSSVVEGSRIRVTRVNGSRTPGRKESPLVAIVQRVTTDSISFGPAGSVPVTIALTELESLEVSSGRRTNGRRGMAVGLGLGAVGGALLGATSGDDIFFTAEEAAALGAVLFGAIGAAAGGLVGLAAVSDRWEPVSLGPRSRRVGARPVVGASHVGVSVRVLW